METLSGKMMSRHDVVNRVQTSLLSVEVRDVYVDVEGDLTLRTPKVMFASLLTAMPRCSSGASEDKEAALYRQSGDVIFMPSHVPWRFTSGTGRFRTVTSEYNRETFGSVARACGEDVVERAFQQYHYIRNWTISSTLGRLAREVEAPGLASAIMVEGLGLSLLANLARHLNGRSESVRDDRTLTPGQMGMLRDYILDGEASQPSLTELARFCKLSRRTFTRRFRATTGVSVGSWVTDLKIDMAKQLLVRRMSVKEVAYKLGFSNQSNFAVAFRRAVGMAPTEYVYRSAH